MTITCQIPLSMGFSWQEYWSGLPCPPPGDLPDPEIEPLSPVLQADPLPLSHWGSPNITKYWVQFPVLYSRSLLVSLYFKKRGKKGTSLVIQWFRIHLAIQWDTGSIPGWGTKISHALEQLTLHTTTEPKHNYLAHTPQLLSPRTTTRVCVPQWKILHVAIKTWLIQINKYLAK